ncbi:MULTISPECIES: hypothetical protein [Vibrio]|uniref:hypothetical protein n=1 Tax=Vibrio TaxID=662 RepID=UPI002076243D|nr:MULTISPECIES: hypothetical protein [Vibrio]USD34452.1 hypothetical protein J8Z27_20715 [Vibrio sp. SCSIO 43186]USD47524.1 hypothetical protein J4N38_21115 [Vibrio sp. SCSIO 43145]USD71577.1 hypothetical protein J4N41_20730 [Vibrio sp. SCSIO 43139]USD98482.1 hypothetical protein CTT30_20920 [Vibrio coralliilyticus]
MTDLHQAFASIGADAINAVAENPALWQQFLQQHTTLFEKVKQHKPDSADESHLLGIMTKAHIECLSRVEVNREAVKVMWQALHENLGTDNAKRFEYQDYQMLTLVTHVWLYVQGYLKMDFSLANDHAETTAQLQGDLSGLDVDTIRTQFLASYYLGSENSPISKPHHPIWDWFKKIFS